MERTQNQRTSEIIQWRESITTLPDHHFFELMREYLGEIKTPYNKQKLIESLSAFLRKEENKATIIEYLSDVDSILLSAIMNIPNATQEKICVFFKNLYSFNEIYERLMNLEERLLIYRHQEENSKKILFSINPLLWETLEPYIRITKLLPVTSKEKITKIKVSSAHNLTPSLLAAIYSFISENPNICKIDGVFKKKMETIVFDAFPQYSDPAFMQKLILALRNLGLFKQTEVGLIPDNIKWKQFADLPEEIQYVYIAASAQAHYPRDILQRQAQLVLDLISSMPEEGYTLRNLLRAAYFLQEETEVVGQGSVKIGRFASILKAEADKEASLLKEKNENEKKEENASIHTEIHQLVQDTILFGLIRNTCIDDTDEPIYTPMDLYKTSKPVETTKALELDAGFSVIIMPCLPLSVLLPIVQCMELQSYDTILKLTITRGACMRCFDSGISPKTLYSDIERVASHELHQSLLVSLEEWYKSYASASLYHGYVLQAVAEKQNLIEKNPEIEQYISLVLAPGIYLMNFSSDEEAVDVIKRSGLDFIGSIKTTDEVVNPLPITSIRMNTKLLAEKTKIPVLLLPGTEATRSTLMGNMRKVVEEKNCTEEQADALYSRIIRKVIINPCQINPESVRMEKTEASGMDFVGKIHVIEYAITSCSMLEITIEDKTIGARTIIGQPLALEKQIGEAYLQLRIELNNEVEEYAVGQIQHLKRIRGSIFKESFN